MREYNIMDRGGKVQWGKLYYNDKKNEFRLKFRDDIDIQRDKPPAYVSRFIINRGTDLRGWIAQMWVTDRIIPKDRKNIVDILREAGLKHYREIDMLELCLGRCTFDNMYLERVK